MNTINSYQVVTTIKEYPVKDLESPSESTMETSVASKNVRFCTDVTVFHYRYKKLSVYRRLKNIIVTQKWKPLISKDG
ncbi:MAG: hypothetical protein EBU90_14230 [Proteobacteria bacterium]|nr:hypothetical protein [Pseudomonadota bacterium]NBP14259.1 hypothetical protein [bacterium]